jgi:hypothetical protein
LVLTAISFPLSTTGTLSLTVGFLLIETCFLSIAGISQGTSAPSSNATLGTTLSA